MPTIGPQGELTGGSLDSIAIIGAGPAGLCLALSLHFLCPKIKTTIYEIRKPTTSTYGALTFSPNSLYILSKIGIYDRIKELGFQFENIIFRNSLDEITDSYAMGSKVNFDYKALRVYRQIILHEFRAAIAERGIKIIYGRKFTRVISENAEGVTFEFGDGCQDTASLLVGTDGIYSQVRRYLHPTVEPIYSGNMCVTSVVSRSSLRLPYDDYHLPASIHSSLGAIVLAPQNPDGSEILILTQNRHVGMEKEKWEEVRTDKDKLLSIITANKEHYPDVVQSAMEGVELEKLSIFPFYFVPHLENWISETGNVLIMGDAAHALPPAAGQGASQALEDVYSFSYLLSKIIDRQDIDAKAAISRWEKYRMEKMERVMELTRKLSNRRLPVEELTKLSGEDTFIEEGEGGQVWLYSPRIENNIDGLVVGCDEKSCSVEDS